MDLERKSQYQNYQFRTLNRKIFREALMVRSYYCDFRTRRLKTVKYLKRSNVRNQFYPLPSNRFFTAEFGNHMTK